MYYVKINGTTFYRYERSTSNAVVQSIHFSCFFHFEFHSVEKRVIHCGFHKW